MIDILNKIDSKLKEKFNSVEIITPDNEKKFDYRFIIENKNMKCDFKINENDLLLIERNVFKGEYLSDTNDLNSKRIKRNCNFSDLNEMVSQIFDKKMFSKSYVEYSKVERTERINMNEENVISDLIHEKCEIDDYKETAEYIEATGKITVGHALMIESLLMKRSDINYVVYNGNNKLKIYLENIDIKGSEEIINDFFKKFDITIEDLKFEDKCYKGDFKIDNIEASFKLYSEEPYIVIRIDGKFKGEKREELIQDIFKSRVENMDEFFKRYEPNFKEIIEDYR